MRSLLPLTFLAFVALAFFACDERAQGARDLLTDAREIGIVGRLQPLEGR